MGTAPNKGNIIQISRGNLPNLLNARALAKGELFLATTEISEADALTIASTEDGAAQRVVNISGKKPSIIRKIERGDLFAGSNSQYKVYALGSSGALKWGGVSATESWEDAKRQAEDAPNYIFMYVGTSTLRKEGKYDSDFFEKQEDAEKTEVKEKYEAVDSLEYDDPINPGDIFFYSSNINQIVVLHLNHSTDALTKINMDVLVSDSMRNLLDESYKGDGEGERNPATLKTFLDGPARHYQYLVNEYGWKPLQEGLDGNFAQPLKVVEGSEILEVATKIFYFNDPEDGDGVIHYIPFSKGRETWSIENCEGINPYEIFQEGDLIVTLPNLNDGGVYHRRISLYGGLIKQISGIEITRADEYATTIWNITDDTENGRDDNFVNARDDKGNYLNGIKEFIERLYKTKVDIDPKTKKIISSQLPDYLLNAPKYMGLMTSLDGGDISETSLSISAEDIFNYWVKEAEKNPKNLDENEDDTETLTHLVNPDKELQVGSYWIWQGPTIDVTEYENAFLVHDTMVDTTGETGDDLKETEVESSGIDAYVSETGSEAEDIDAYISDKEQGETETGGEESTGSSGKGSGTSKVTYSIGHMLNPGDWVIYNGEKFEIVDNSSSFVGLLLNGTKLSGLVNLKNSSREMSYYDWKTNSTKKTSETDETTLSTPDTRTLNIENPNSVLFKDGTTARTDDQHIPVISNEGHAHNSRIGLAERQGALEIPGLSSASTTSIKVVFGKWINGSAPANLSDIAKQYTIEDWPYGETGNETKKIDVGVISGKGTGFDFKDFAFTEDEVDTIYNFTILNEKDPTVYFPSHSGTLATEEFVDYGFAVIKQAMDDMYDALIKKMTAGTEDWLQTIIEEKKNGKTVKKLGDSKLRQRYVEDSKLLLDIFYKMPEDDETVRKNPSTGLHSTLAVYKELPNTSSASTDVPRGKHIADIELPGLSGKLNPKTDDGETENILPNHSGILLNDNSVIDCGEW